MKNVLSEFIPTDSLMSAQGEGAGAGTRELNAEGAWLVSRHNSAALRRIAPQCFSASMLQSPVPAARADQWADQPIIASTLIVDISISFAVYISLL